MAHSFQKNAIIVQSITFKLLSPLWLIRQEKLLVDAVGGTRVGVDVVAGGAACLLQGVVVAEQAVEDSMALLCIVYSKSSTTLLEFESLAELLVTWAKDDWNAVDSSLRNIVYAGAETSTHIGHVAIAIKRRENAKAVDYHAVEL